VDILGNPLIDNHRSGDFFLSAFVDAPRIKKKNFGWRD